MVNAIEDELLIYTPLPELPENIQSVIVSLEPELYRPAPFAALFEWNVHLLIVGSNKSYTSPPRNVKACKIGISAGDGKAIQYCCGIEAGTTWMVKDMVAIVGVYTLRANISTQDSFVGSIHRIICAFACGTFASGKAP